MDDQEYAERSIDVALGVEAETFLGTELGKWILDESDRQVDLLRAEFECLGNSETEKMQDLHFKMKVAREAINWLGTAIQNGRHTLRLIQSDMEAPE